MVDETRGYIRLTAAWNLDSNWDVGYTAVVSHSWGSDHQNNDSDKEVING